MPTLAGQVENEHFCLRLASEMGLRTSLSSVVRIGGVLNIVSQRYDRIRADRGRQLPLTESGGQVYRIHQEDLCQALGYHPDSKYQRDGGPGIRDIMRLPESSGDSKTDRDRFMRASIFIFVILGVDAHAKNFSILMEHSGRFRLAPLYDVISALPYSLKDYNSLAMNIGGERKWTKISKRHWSKEASACGYPEDAAFSELKRMVHSMPSVARNLLSTVAKEGLVSPVLGTLADRLEERCAVLSEEFG